MASHDRLPNGFVMASERATTPPGADAPLDIDPADLTGVGSGTTAIIKGASFDASDIILKHVSYRMLLDAGITQRIADQLRRSYSLVWTFYWEENPDLDTRAEQISGLTDGEREWVAASTTPRTTPPRDDRDPWSQRIDSERDHSSKDPTNETGSGDPTDGCPRCGGTISVYAIGEDETYGCDDCGYVGIELTPPSP